MLYADSRATFIEDKEMLKAQQKNLKVGALDGLIHISADAAQMQARQMLDEMMQGGGGVSLLPALHVRPIRNVQRTPAP
jgi:hypothetical protein